GSRNRTSPSLLPLSLLLLQISNGLLRTFLSRLRNLDTKEIGATLRMSLIVFIAICVLACGFMLFIFFEWTVGDKRRTRRPPSRRSTAQPASSPLHLATSQAKNWDHIPNARQLN